MADYFEDELDGIRGVVARALPDGIGGTLLRWPAATWKDGRARIPAGVVADIVDPIVERLTDGPEASLTTGRPHPAVLKLRKVRAERDEARTEVERRGRVLDAVRAWAEDEYGDSTDVPTGLAMVIYGSGTTC